MYIRFGNNTPKLVITDTERQQLADPATARVIIERARRITENGAPVDVSVLERTPKECHTTT